MKYIELTQGKRAAVDDEDFEWLNYWKWYYQKSPNGRGGYAARGIRDSRLPGGYLNVMMHRFINRTPDGLLTDHKNWNKLDNRRSNLVTATESQNRYNTPLRSDNTSGHKGISWYKQTSRWVAKASVGGKLRTLGYFTNIEDAVKARQEVLGDLDI
jgi:hypothetical protein